MEEESVGRSRDPGATAGDLNESLMIGPVDPPDPAYAAAGGAHFAPNLWPERPADLRPAWTEYYRAMGSLAETLMRIFALALGQPEHHFDPLVDRHISRLRVRNYPAPATPPVPGQIRAGAHSDYGSLTILCTEDRAGGLQVCNSNGDWVDVPILPDTLIVNIGDLLARWTNDTWVSTLHRVVNPPAGAGAESRRQSLVFFHNPNYDAPDHEPGARGGEVPAHNLRRAPGAAVHGDAEPGGGGGVAVWVARENLKNGMDCNLVRGSTWCGVATLSAPSR